MKKFNIAEGGVGNALLNIEQKINELIEWINAIEQDIATPCDKNCPVLKKGKGVSNEKENKK